MTCPVMETALAPCGMMVNSGLVITTEIGAATIVKLNEAEALDFAMEVATSVGLLSGAAGIDEGAVYWTVEVVVEAFVSTVGVPSVPHVGEHGANGLPASSCQARP